MRRRTFTQPASVFPARRGVFLIEMMITIAVGSVVLGLGMGMLHLMLQTDKTLADSLWRGQTVSQLSQVFRGDVHAAREVKTEADQETALTLALGKNHRVRYSLEKSLILRTETQADKTLRTERFRFPEGTKISFNVDNPARVALVIATPNPHTMKTNRSQNSVPLRELKIEAVPGRDHRFENSQNKGAAL